MRTTSTGAARVMGGEQHFVVVSRADEELLRPLFLHHQRAWMSSTPTTTRSLNGRICSRVSFVKCCFTPVIWRACVLAAPRCSSLVGSPSSARNCMYRLRFVRSQTPLSITLTFPAMSGTHRNPRSKHL